MKTADRPSLLILNQMAGPLTWELAEDLGTALGPVALLTGHPDTLAKGSTDAVRLSPAAPYVRGSLRQRATSWARYLWQALVWLLRQPGGAPLLLVSNPPLLPWVGYLLHRLRGQRYAVYVHDIYPDILVRMGTLSERSAIVRVWRWLNRAAYKHADVVITLSDGMAATLAQQFEPSHTPAGRIEIVPPWADTDVIKPIPKERNPFAVQHGQVGKFTVMYAGNMGLSHDLDTMVEAAQRLAYREDIHFFFVGDGVKWRDVAASLQAHPQPNVSILPWQSEEHLPYILATAEVGLVSLEPQVVGLAVPSKTMYYMAAGAAVIGLCAQSSDLAAALERSQAGVVIEPRDIGRLTECLLHLAEPAALERLSRAARQEAETVYARKHSTARIGLIVSTYSTLNRTIAAQRVEDSAP